MRKNLFFAKLKSFKAPGRPDGIHPYIVIPLRNVQIVYVSHCAYVQSITSIWSVTPRLECANIIPVFKKGVESEASNYIYSHNVVIASYVEVTYSHI